VSTPTIAATYDSLFVALGPLLVGGQLTIDYAAKTRLCTPKRGPREG